MIQTYANDKTVGAIAAHTEIIKISLNAYLVQILPYLEYEFKKLQKKYLISFHDIIGQEIGKPY